MIKIPYGISGFETIRKEGFKYVDKTKYIRNIETERYCMYVRPRRFGKTLFTTTLNAYYSIDKKDEYEQLFKGLEIYDNPTEKRNSYYIMNFDFSGMMLNSKMDIKGIEEAFNAVVYTHLNEFVNRYKLDIQVKESITAAQMLRDCLGDFQGLHLENNIYIIVDEYDHFTNGLLEGECKTFLDILGKSGFVRAFYEVIKLYTKYNVVERFFATGVAPLTLDSMTSGFNITTSLTLNPQYVAMTGLTEEEVRNLVSEVEENKEKQEKILKDLVDNYDGYKFSKSNLEHIFNPTLVMYYLNNYVKLGIRPDEIVDKNLSTNAEKLKNLMLIKTPEENSIQIQKLILEGEVSGNIVQSFELDKTFSSYDFLSLLFYNGYITIKEVEPISNLVKFVVPNFVSYNLYAQYMLNLISAENRVKVDIGDLQRALVPFATEGNLVPILEWVRNFLMYSSVRDKENFKEQDLKHIIHLIFTLTTQYDVYTEFPSLQGYTDVYIRNKDRSLNICEGLIELKYLSKKDSSKAKIEKAKNEAKEQLKNYMKDERLQANKNLRKYVVVFVGFEEFYVEEVEA